MILSGLDCIPLIKGESMLEIVKQCDNPVLLECCVATVHKHTVHNIIHYHFPALTEIIHK